MTIWIARQDLKSRPGVMMRPVLDARAMGIGSGGASSAPAPAPPPPAPPALTGVFAFLEAGADAVAIAGTVTPSAPEDVIFFGEDVFPSFSVGGAPLAARDSFVGAVSNESVITFEAVALGGAYGVDPIAGVAFVGPLSAIEATFTTTGQMRVVETPVGGYAGRFNTTPGGTRFLDFQDNLTIELSAPVNAFGFYGTDVGDFDGQVKVTLTDDVGGTQTLDVPHSLLGNDGALLFWGVVRATPIASARLFCVPNTVGLTDYFGVDDIIIGSLPL